MAGRCSAPSSLRRETVERLDGRPRYDLILRSPRSGRLEGRSRRRRRARWSVLRDAPPAAPLLRTRRPGRTAATLSVTVARKIRRKPLKRLIPRPGLRRTRNFRPLRPAGTCFETRRFASLLSMRVASACQPPRRLTIARKFCCKPLKRLIPRPAFRRPPKPSAARMRRNPGPARPPLTRSGETRRRLTIARKFRRKPLKRLIPRPGLRPTRNFRPLRSAGPCFEMRRFASLLSIGAASARPPPWRLRIARKFCCKPLKRLIPRPARSSQADGAEPPRPPWALDPGIAGRTDAPGAKFPGGGRRPEPGRSPEGAHGGLCVGCPVVIPPPASSAISPPAPACAGLRSRR